MNTLDGNVVSLHPAGEQSQRWLALSLGNGARQAEASLEAAEESSAALLQTCQNLTGLAADAEALCDEFESLAEKVERCLALSHQFAQI